MPGQPFWLYRFGFSAGHQPGIPQNGPAGLPAWAYWFGRFAVAQRRSGVPDPRCQFRHDSRHYSRLESSFCDSVRNTQRLPKATGGAPSAATALLIGSLVCVGASTGVWASPGKQGEVENRSNGQAGTPGSIEIPVPTIADSIIQEVRAEGTFIFAKANIRWRAEKGETLPLFSGLVF